MSEPMISVAGIRGIVGESLLPESFLRYILAFASLVEGGAVVVGGDTRLSREMMRHLAFAGLASAGCEIHDIGLAPTPTVGFMVRELGARGGIAITASHNPAQWNAYKFFDSDGMFPGKQANAQLLEIAAGGAFLRADYRHLGRVTPRADAIGRHVARVCEAVNTAQIRARRFRVTADCCNSVGGLILKPLFEQLGCEAEMFFTDIDREFQRPPEPLPENLDELCGRVRAAGADIGFAVDPDADRLAIVDNTGRPIGEERTVALAAAAVLNRVRGPLVVNLSTTRAMDDLARRHGVQIFRTPIGEANVVQRIRASNAVIGGEGNGGVIYPPVHCGRDAATGVALILGAMAAGNATIAELNTQIPDYVMIKTKFDAAGMDMAMLARMMSNEFSDAVEIITTDGVKAVYADSWVHARASGTEPVVRVFAEAPTRQAAEALAARAQKARGCADADDAM
ncbi:MAG: phosphoglucosamine mutase [Candidatus Sumerlaeota bacterium]|nr:phosphoglucosamine mutase [Candidatus Sumerlaeota bacterium]